MKRKFNLKTILILVLSIIILFPSDIKADDEEFDITNIKKAGTYFVTVYAHENGNTVEKQVAVVVTFASTVVNENNNEAIDAKDFKILAKEDINSLTVAELIDKANAYAWNLDTNQDIPITSVEVHELKDNLWEVTFATEKGTSVTVLCNVVDDIILDLYHQSFHPKQEVNVNHFTFSTILAITLIVPILIYFSLLYRANQKQREVERLLYEESKRSHSI